MTKVFKSIKMSVEDYRKLGTICAWRNCHETFKGNMPKGWTFLLSYWGKTPVCDFARHPPALGDWFRDAALCPQHSFELEIKLKELGRALNEPAAGCA
jgi:hypothetical protein